MAQKRKTLTKQTIKESLIQLLSEEKFETISVSKLCLRAGINRGTFYLHYEDKYDLIETLKEEVLEELHNLFEQTSSASPHELLTKKLKVLQKNARFINAASKSKYIDFRESIREFMCDTLLNERHIQDTQLFLKEHFNIPEKYALESFLSSNEGIISLWISSGAKETPQEMADIILSNYNLRNDE